MNDPKPIVRELVSACNTKSIDRLLALDHQDAEELAGPSGPFHGCPEPVR